MSIFTYGKRVWIVKQYLRGILAKNLALAQKTHRSAVYQILEKYKIWGWDGLKDYKIGRLETFFNKNAEIIILDLKN